MKPLLGIVVALHLGSLTPAILVLDNSSSLDLHDGGGVRSRWNLANLNIKYNGILWDYAVGNGSVTAPGNCDDVQLTRLVNTTESAMKMLELPHSDEDYEFSWAWTRYFGSYNWWLSFPRYMVHAHNMFLASTSPKKGKPGNAPRSKVIFSCSEKEETVKRCGRNGVAAFTIKGGYSVNRPNPVPWLKPLTNRMAGPKRPVSEVYLMRTHESLLIHEFMHVGMFGYTQYISDHVDNTTVADNYAWFYTYYYFTQYWGWGAEGDPSHGSTLETNCTGCVGSIQDDSITNEETEPLPEPSFPLNEKDINLSTEFPENCQLLDDKDSHGDPEMLCNYVGMDYNEWKTELYSFFSSEGGCRLSPWCHKSVGFAVDPKCQCFCDDKITPLRDPKCAGFEGGLPGDPHHLNGLVV
ncbi:hypothetical protein K491DRAFT_676821 [Lophiostoma macrostomum CBS 122681]|uniref:Uncharacterized protein n=1 Tax=Lophiostoma macrostomum CBS 122681 TaxID=1314788 RepID=A0A6A6TEA4_9PLEO|nr:hypothetical protein K491DRAFT_676821 [Lophiostoma macrostomum CBS 122681]